VLTVLAGDVEVRVVDNGGDASVDGLHTASQFSPEHVLRIEDGTHKPACHEI
jgi:hypothetical protein